MPSGERARGRKKTCELDPLLVLLCTRVPLTAVLIARAKVHSGGGRRVRRGHRTYRPVHTRVTMLHSGGRRSVGNNSALSAQRLRSMRVCRSTNAKATTLLRLLVFMKGLEVEVCKRYVPPAWCMTDHDMATMMARTLFHFAEMPGTAHPVVARGERNKEADPR